MQDRPTAAELLEALGEFMRDRAGHARDRWERFQFQVAANSLGILQREWEDEDEHLRTEWAGLDGLLGEEPVPEGQHAFASRLAGRNAELIERIHRGEFDGAAEDQLVAHLYETVVNKVRIASPREAPAAGHEE